MEHAKLHDGGNGIRFRLRLGTVKLLPYQYARLIFGHALADQHIAQLVKDLNETCDRCKAAEDRVWELECQIADLKVSPAGGGVVSPADGAGQFPLTHLSPGDPSLEERN